MTLNLQIITPEKVVYTDEVNQVTVPTTNGEITILPNHVGLVSKIEPGELMVKKGSNIQYLAITGGFLEVSKNKVIMLLDYAVQSDQINVEKALEAQKRAELLKKQAKEQSSEKDLALAESQMRRAILELKVANRRRKRSNI